MAAEDVCQPMGHDMDQITADMALAMELQQEEEVAQQALQDQEMAQAMFERETQHAAELERQEEKDRMFAKQVGNSYPWAKQPRQHPLACDSMDVFEEADLIQFDQEACSSHPKVARKIVAEDHKVQEKQHERENLQDQLDKAVFDGGEYKYKPDKSPSKQQLKGYSWQTPINRTAPPSNLPDNHVWLPFGFQWIARNNNTAPTPHGRNRRHVQPSAWAEAEKEELQRKSQLRALDELKNLPLKGWNSEDDDSELDEFTTRKLHRMKKQKREAEIRRLKEKHRDKAPPSAKWRIRADEKKKARKATEHIRKKVKVRGRSLRTLQHTMLQNELPSLSEQFHNWGFAGLLPAPVSKDVARRFHSKMLQTGEEPVIQYHGTRQEHIGAILEGGFKIPGKGNNLAVVNGSAHGLGIYTAPQAATSRGYARNCDKLIVCAVLPTDERNYGWCQVSVDESRVLPLFVAYWGEDGRASLMHDLSLEQQKEMLLSGEACLGALFSEVLHLGYRDKSLLGRLKRKELIQERERQRKERRAKQARAPFTTTYSFN